MPTNIKCKHCHGTGLTALPEHLQKTLDEVKKKAGSLMDISGRLGINSTAMSNRLSELHQLGLVSFTTSGRARTYKAMNPGTQLRKGGKV